MTIPRSPSRRISWPLRVLIEVIDVPKGAELHCARLIIAHLDGLGLPTPRLLHGEENATWRLITEAARGWPCRPASGWRTYSTADGRPVSGNANLVHLALRRYTTVS